MQDERYIEQTKREKEHRNF